MHRIAICDDAGRCNNQYCRERVEQSCFKFHIEPKMSAKCRPIKYLAGQRQALLPSHPSGDTLPSIFCITGTPHQLRALLRFHFHSDRRQPAAFPWCSTDRLFFHHDIPGYASPRSNQPDMIPLKSHRKCIWSGRCHNAWYDANRHRAVPIQ